MKNSKRIRDLAVLMGTSILFFCPSLAGAEFHGGVAARCETLLGHSNSQQTALFDTLAELDDLKPGLPASVQAQIDRLVDEGLSANSNVDRVWLQARRLLGQIISTKRERPCLGDFVHDPAGLQAGLDYETGDPHLRSVSFEAQALKEMQRLDDLTSERLLRSIKKGFVPPASGTGVVRLTDLHKNLVEVKIIRKSVTRLIGCLQAGHLAVKRVHHKRNEGRGGSLGIYRDLCD